jgi:hypothetical protein
MTCTRRHTIGITEITLRLPLLRSFGIMLFRETIAVYTENHMKHINTAQPKTKSFVNVKAGGAYSYH